MEQSPRFRAFHDGRKKVRGLNRRFRVYRYVPGAEYVLILVRTISLSPESAANRLFNPDGAWPPSAIDPTTDKYIYDSSRPEAKQSSLFTFLIYLNDEFEAGETTFFLPSAREGTMNAYPSSRSKEAWRCSRMARLKEVFCTKNWCAQRLETICEVCHSYRCVI